MSWLYFWDADATIKLKNYQLISNIVNYLGHITRPWPLGVSKQTMDANCDLKSQQILWNYNLSWASNMSFEVLYANSRVLQHLWTKRIAETATSIFQETPWRESSRQFNRSWSPLLLCPLRDQHIPTLWHWCPLLPSSIHSHTWTAQRTGQADWLSVEISQRRESPYYSLHQKCLAEVRAVLLLSADQRVPRFRDQTDYDALCWTFNLDGASGKRARQCFSVSSFEIWCCALSRHQTSSCRRTFANTYSQVI